MNSASHPDNIVNLFWNDRTPSANVFKDQLAFLKEGCDFKGAIDVLGISWNAWNGMFVKSYIASFLRNHEMFEKPMRSICLPALFFFQ